MSHKMMTTVGGGALCMVYIFIVQSSPITLHDYGPLYTAMNMNVTNPHRQRETLPVFSPHCPSLIAGDQAEVTSTAAMLYKESRRGNGPEYYISITKNCSCYQNNYFLSTEFSPKYQGKTYEDFSTQEKFPHRNQNKVTQDNFTYQASNYYQNKGSEGRTKGYYHSSGPNNHSYYRKTNNNRNHRTDDISNRFAGNFHKADEISHNLFSNPDESFPLAYSLCVHNNIEQVERLLRAVYRPWNIYCIHVDQKSAALFHEAIRSIVVCLPNVFIATALEWVVPEGYSRLKADINCLADLLNSSVPWKYVINLAGHDFPLKNNYRIVKTLKQLRGKNDIPSIEPRLDITEQFKFVHERTIHDNVETLFKTSRYKSLPPGNVSIRYGSAYNIISREFVEYVLKDAFPQKLLHWFKNSLRPAEHFWATLQVGS